MKREFDFYAGREHAEWQDSEFDGEVCDDISIQIKALQEIIRGGINNDKQNNKIIRI